MNWSKERLEKIFNRSSGKCHICHGRLEISKHGKQSKEGGWHVEHSVPRAIGGTDRLNNLFPAHVKCNLEKGVASSPSARRKHGKTRAPLSVEKRKQAKFQNGVFSGGAIALASAFLRIHPATGAIATVIAVAYSFLQDPDENL